MKQREYCPYCQGGPCTGKCDKDTGTRYYGKIKI